MKTLKIFLVVSLYINLGQAQKSPIKFGDISVDQLKMSRYEKDSSAAAVILADFGESSILYDDHDAFVLNFERIRRIKILTKDGLSWGDFRITLYHSDAGEDEKIQNLKAATYNLENGKIVESKLKSESIFREKYDANFDIVTVTWPNVKEGSIIELSYNIKSEFLMNFQDWQFQETIPVMWSEYRTRIPEYFNYDKYMQGYITLSIQDQSQVPQSIDIQYRERDTSGKANVQISTVNNAKLDYLENRFRWVAKDVPAFKSEPYLTTYLDYISKINFELDFTKFPNQPVKSYMGSWEDINKLYAESPHFGREVTGNGFLKENVEEIIKGLSIDEERIAAIYNYVKKAVSWNGSSTTLTTKSIKKVLEDKKGNSAEVNLLLASMLEKAGITVFPVLLSTRDHGFLRESNPMSTQFNYVICAVQLNDRYILLDATEDLLPMGILPERCLNGKGLIVSKAGHSWIEVQSPGKSKTLVNADLTLDKSGELKGKLQISYVGYDALKVRKSYIKGESDYIKDFLGDRSWELTSNEFKNAGDVEQPFIQSHDLIIKEHMASGGEMLYLSPFIMNQKYETPFKQETRQYPVNFGSPFDQTYMIKIALPEEFSVEDLPESKAFIMPENAARYSYGVKKIDNTIIITSSMSVNKSIFTQIEYPNLREFYSQVIAKQAEQIVLKRK